MLEPFRDYMNSCSLWSVAADYKVIGYSAGFEMKGQYGWFRSVKCHTISESPIFSFSDCKRARPTPDLCARCKRAMLPSNSRDQATSRKETEERLVRQCIALSVIQVLDLTNSFLAITSVAPKRTGASCRWQKRASE